MTTSSSSQVTKILMANHHYRYQNLHYLLSLLTVFILLIQTPVAAITQQSQYDWEASQVSPNKNFHSTITTLSTTLNNNHEDILYDGDNENSSGGEIYDDGEEFDEQSPATTIPQSELNHNRTSYDIQINDYDDEASSYQDNPDDNEESHIYADTMSVNRPESKPPMIESNESESTTRIPLIPSNLWRDIFSKPAILVGIIGGIVIGMLSAILLVMFIIYRMRKKDEGSYALEEGPKKSSSHAYTRVSSREFFA